MIERRIKEQLCEIALKAKKINKIILFGSRAVGDHNEKSDIDLAFEAPDMTNAEWTAFTFDLEERLETLLLLDLIKFEDAPIPLKDEVLKYGKIIWERCE